MSSHYSASCRCCLRLVLSYFKNPGYVDDSIFWIIAFDYYKADFPYKIWVDSHPDPKNSTLVNASPMKKKRILPIRMQDFLKSL